MTRKNQFELVTASFNNQEEPVWVSHSRFQWQWKTSLSQFLEELVCLCHAQQLVSTTSHNQIERVSTTRKNQFQLVTTSFNHKEKMVWASYSQFQQAEKTRKNQFFCLCHAQEPVLTTSHNQFEWVSTTRKNQFWPSHNQFQSQGKMVWASYSQFQPAVRTRKK